MGKVWSDMIDPLIDGRGCIFVIANFKKDEPWVYKVSLIFCQREFRNQPLLLSTLAHQSCDRWISDLPLPCSSTSSSIFYGSHKRSASRSLVVVDNVFFISSQPV